MTKYERTKNVVEGIIAASVGLVVTQVIAKNIPADLKFLPRTGVKLGTLVIASLLSEAAAKKATDGLDNIVDGVKLGVEKAEEEIALAEEALKAVEKVYEEAEAEKAQPAPKRKPSTKKIDTTLPNPED